jgi:hypothetical protein
MTVVESAARTEKPHCFSMVSGKLIEMGGHEQVSPNIFTAGQTDATAEQLN